MRAVRLCIIVVCISCMCGGCTRKTRRGFSRAMFYTYSHDGPNIILGMVSQDDWHTSGTFDFENISGERQQAKDAMLRGVKRGGGFWPYVRCEARRKDSTVWDKIGESWVFGWPSRLVVKAESKPVEFSVRLDVFEDLVSKYEFGRIVLSSGDTSQFLLEDLTAPNTQSSNHAMERTSDRCALHF